MVSGIPLVESEGGNEETYALFKEKYAAAGLAGGQGGCVERSLFMMIFTPWNLVEDIWTLLSSLGIPMASQR